MIDIALASDANYACGLLVTAVSMARSASPDAVLRFNVMDGGMSNEVWEDFTAHVQKAHPLSEFRRFKVDDACFSAYPAWSGTSRMTYARLLLPQVLSDVEYVIYCDVDFLWQADVAELWRQRNPHVIVKTTREGKVQTRRIEEPWFRERNLPYSFDRYFCAGLLLFNLNQCRRFRVFEKMLQFLDVHPDVQAPDQTALNAVLQKEKFGDEIENVCLLSPKWQVFAGDVTDELLQNGCVIHYAGTTPWRLPRRWVLLSDTLMLWHRLNGVIYGIGSWGSLRRFFPIHRIIWRRMEYLAFSTAGIRSICWIILYLTGHRECVRTFRKECRRLKFGLERGGR